VCGDGLTPRAVRQVQAMGVDVSPPGWTVNRGVRFVGGRTRLELDWPQLVGTPAFGATRGRRDLDALLVERATAAGAQLCTRTSVIGPAQGDPAWGTRLTAEVGPDRTRRTFHSPLVVVASGASGRLPLALGFPRRPGTPIGVGVRRYRRAAERHRDPFLEVVLDVPTSARGRGIVPGYGWVFGVGDGRVNVGLAVYDSAGRYRGTDHRRVFGDWLRATAPTWGLAPEAAADGPVLGGAIPMGFSRPDPHQRGVLLVGDCAGTANPFNGEGIAYAMESGALAAEVALEALGVPAGARREAVLQRYSAELSARYARYYRLGRRFVEVVDNGPALGLGIRYLLPHAALMRLVFKLVSHLFDPGSPEAADRIIAALLRTTPAA
jgi:flavin-dependent dehydrogenase